MTVLLTILGISIYVICAAVVILNAELHDVWEKGFFTFFLTFISAICPVVNTVCAVFAIRTDVFRYAAKNFWEDIKDTYKRH